MLKGRKFQFLWVARTTYSPPQYPISPLSKGIHAARRQTNLACFGLHDNTVSHRVWEVEALILADPKNDFSSPILHHLWKNVGAVISFDRNHVPLRLSWLAIQSPSPTSVAVYVKSTMTRLSDHTSPRLEYVSSRWHGRYKRKLPCTTCTTCFTSAIPGLSDNITCSPVTRKCYQHCPCRANMFVVIPPLMIVRQPDQCQGQHSKK